MSASQFQKPSLNGDYADLGQSKEMKQNERSELTITEPDYLNRPDQSVVLIK